MCSRLRELYAEWRAADELYGMWRRVDEVRDDLDDPWESLGEELANSGPPTPDAALEALGTLPVEIQAMGGEPFATWPLVATGERQGRARTLGRLSGLLDHSER